jgi:hypothetical protein
MDRRDMELKYVDWIYLAQDRDRWECFEHGGVGSGSLKGESCLDWLSA